MLKKLNIDVDRMINLLIYYKETDVDNEEMKYKKYYIDSLMDNKKKYPVADEEYMNRLNDLVRHKFLGEEFRGTKSITKTEQCNKVNATW